MEQQTPARGTAARHLVRAGVAGVAAVALGLTPVGLAHANTPMQKPNNSAGVSPQAKPAANAAGLNQLKSATAQMNASLMQLRYAKHLYQMAQAAGGTATPNGNQIMNQYQAVYSQAQGMFYAATSMWSAAMSAHQARAQKIRAKGKTPISTAAWRKALTNFQQAQAQAASLR